MLKQVIHWIGSYFYNKTEVKPLTRVHVQEECIVAESLPVRSQHNPAQSYRDLLRAEFDAYQQERNAYSRWAPTQIYRYVCVALQGIFFNTSIAFHLGLQWFESQLLESQQWRQQWRQQLLTDPALTPSTRTELQQQIIYLDYLRQGVSGLDYLIAVEVVLVSQSIAISSYMLIRLVKRYGIELTPSFRYALYLLAEMSGYHFVLPYLHKKRLEAAPAMDAPDLLAVNRKLLAEEMSLVVASDYPPSELSVSASLTAGVCLLNVGILYHQRHRWALQQHVLGMFPCFGVALYNQLSAVENARLPPDAQMILPNQPGDWIDLDHFIYAQQRLASGAVPLNVLFNANYKNSTAPLHQLRQVIHASAETRPLSAEDYHALMVRGYDADLIDLIIGNNYQDPRLRITIVGQNPDPRTQSILEAISNSIDASGGQIGQFGKGVKQIIDWLREPGDQLEVWARPAEAAAAAPAYYLPLLVGRDRRVYTQPKIVSLSEYQQAIASQQTHGVMLRLTMQKVLSEAEQRALRDRIKERFHSVNGIVISVSIAGEDAQIINQSQERRVVIGKAIKPLDSQKQVSVQLDEHQIIVSDQGKGEDAALISKMFVPKQGNKESEAMSAARIAETLAHIQLFYDPSLSGPQVDFIRHDEVIASVRLPSDILPEAVMPGRLGIELGDFITVSESRNQVLLVTDEGRQQQNLFALGISHVVQQLLSLQLVDSEKLRYINTVTIAIDGLIKDNSQYVQMVKTLRSEIAAMLAPMIARLQKQGSVFLPHFEHFAQLKIAPHQSVIYLHDKLFAWQGMRTLEQLGGKRIPGVTIFTGEEHLPLVMFPFHAQALDRVSAFQEHWYEAPNNPLPILITESEVIIPQQLSWKLHALASKRQAVPLNEVEKRALAMLLQCVQTLLEKTTTTDYEVTQVTRTLWITPEVEPSSSTATPLLLQDSAIDAKPAAEFLSGGDFDWKQFNPSLESSRQFNLSVIEQPAYYPERRVISAFYSITEHTAVILSCLKLDKNPDGRLDHSSLEVKYILPKVSLLNYRTGELIEFIEEPHLQQKLESTDYEVEKNILAITAEYLIIRTRILAPSRSFSFVTLGLWTMVNPRKMLALDFLNTGDDSDEVLYIHSMVFHLFQPDLLRLAVFSISTGLEVSKKLMTMDLRLNIHGDLPYSFEIISRQLLSLADTPFYLSNCQLAFDSQGQQLYALNTRDIRIWPIREKATAQFKEIPCQSALVFHNYPKNLVYCSQSPQTTPHVNSMSNFWPLEGNLEDFFTYQISGYGIISRISKDCRFVIIKGGNATFQIRNIATGQLLVTYAAPKELVSQLRDIIFSADNRHYIVVYQQFLQIRPFILHQEREELQRLRESMVVQTRQAYQPFLQLTATISIDESWVNALLPVFTALYQNQQQALYQAFVNQAASLSWPQRLQILAQDPLPISAFSRKMPKIIALLQEILPSLGIIQQENLLWQRQFHTRLFASLFNIASITEYELPQDTAYLAFVLGLGYPLQRPDQYIALPQMQQLLHIFFAEIQAELPVLEKLFTFIGSVSQQSSMQHKLIMQQLQRLQHHPRRQHFLGLLLKNFAAVDMKKIDDYLAHMGDIAYQASLLLGSARSFVIFLTYAVDPIAQGSIPVYAGELMPLPPGGVNTSQLMALNDQYPRKNSDDWMPLSYVAERLAHLPPSNQKLERDIARDIQTQREAGAYTAELTQNALDATQGKNGSVRIRFYLYQDAEGKIWFVEEVSDNGYGPGLNQEIAFLIPKSTKASGQQIQTTGYFGTGKYTAFAGVDELRVVTRNKRNAYQFIWTVDRNERDEITVIPVTQIKVINDPRLSEGVTVLRVTDGSRIIPELEQLLRQAEWRQFAGLVQRADFSILHEQSEAGWQSLKLPCEILATIKEGNHLFSIIAAPGIPSQIVDRAGLRVGPINPEFLTLIPSALRPVIQQLGLHLQIGLPLIRNRASFEHEVELMPMIQRYVAIAYFQAIAYKALTQRTPPFVFAGFPLDWWINSQYDDFIYVQNARTQRVAELINQGQYSKISDADLTALDDHQRFPSYTRLITQLDIDWPISNVTLRISLLSQRQTVLAQAQAKKITVKSPLDKEAAAVLDSIPNSRALVQQSQRVAIGHQQMRQPEDYLATTDYSIEELALIKTALFIAHPLGLRRVELLQGVTFAGAFKYYGAPPQETFFLLRGIATQIAKENELLGYYDEGVYTILHELAHYLEKLMRLEKNTLLNQIFVSPHDVSIGMSHEAIGPFSDAIKYMAALTLYRLHFPGVEFPDNVEFNGNGRRLLSYARPQISPPSSILSHARLFSPNLHQALPKNITAEPEKQQESLIP